ncbi:MAG: cbb3-type cytochrome oxidase assembly protein CcoS [bacterium]
MNIVYLLLPLALLLAATFVGAYVWCAKSGQYEDLTTPAHRILLEDEDIKEKNGVSL